MFAKEPLELPSCCIELSPATWVRVVLELFPKVSKVVTGNREFAAQKVLLCLLVVLRDMKLLVALRTILTSFSHRAVGSSSCMVSGFDNFTPFFRVVNPCFSLKAEDWGKAAPNDCGVFMSPVGTLVEELNIFIGSQSAGFVGNFSRSQAQVNDAVIVAGIKMWAYLCCSF